MKSSQMWGKTKTTDLKAKIRIVNQLHFKEKKVANNNKK